MGRRKFIKSDKELLLLANKFKILSEYSRLKILRVLFGGEMCVKEIMAATDLMQANVSKQLKILYTNKIVECRPDGLQRYYRIIDDTIIQICKGICNN
jgi:DNA-binding transcriptional ArsR family regulator